LNETILQNASRVKAAIKLTQEDSQTIAILRKEVEKTWKLVEQAKNNEEKARKIISDLKNEISHLSKIVDKGSGLNVGEDNSVAKMMEEKAKLENEIATKNDFINQLEQQKTTLMERISRMENDLLREKEEVEKVKHDRSQA
jgi:predicted  nucleic acid-binding Zn-ribbon protein